MEGNRKVWHRTGRVLQIKWFIAYGLKTNESYYRQRQ